MNVVRSDGRSLGVRSRDCQIFWDGRLPHFLSQGAPPTCALCARVELRYKTGSVRQMCCESESLVKSAQFVIIIQTQMQANSRRLLCMPQPGPSCSHAVTAEWRQKVRYMCRDVGLYICISSSQHQSDTPQQWPQQFVQAVTIISVDDRPSAGTC